MKHYFEEILEDHVNLSSKAKKHMKECSICAKEVKLMSKIQQGLNTMPNKKMPLEFKTQLIQLMQRSKCKIWHYVLTMALLLISPLLIAQLVQSNTAHMSENALILTYSILGIIAVLMLIPIAYGLFYTYNKSIKDLENRFDEYLDKPLKSLLG